MSYALKWMEVKTMRCLEGKVLKLIYGTLRILLKSGLPNLLLKIALGYLPHLGLHAQHSRVMMITVNLWLAPIVIRSICMIFLLSVDLFYHLISERLQLRPLLKIKMAILYI
uniref:Uncharacterized protein n=1 Tax=Salix viminalis TaxID=40686 RepID=A0A6N2MDF6_SALVM